MLTKLKRGIKKFLRYILPPPIELNNCKLIIYKPCNYKISDSASFEIHDKLQINLEQEMPYKNKIPGIFYIEDNAKVIADSFRIWCGCRIYVTKNATLKLGTGFINRDSLICCKRSITIGNDVVISHNVIIRDDDGHTILRNGFEKEKSVVIGDHVWIGARVTILKGVTLGNGCIVAAGSLVTKSFPPKSLIGGVPAKLLRSNVDWE